MTTALKSGQATMASREPLPITDAMKARFDREMAKYPKD